MAPPHRRAAAIVLYARASDGALTRDPAEHGVFWPSTSASYCNRGWNEARSRAIGRRRGCSILQLTLTCGLRGRPHGEATRDWSGKPARHGAGGGGLPQGGG